MEKFSGLSHLFMTVFLHHFSTFMVIPAITDVTMAALCPGEDECSLAIYLTGIQQAIIGLGTLLMMPLIGNLSDTYGRKALLTVPMSLTIIPLAILAYDRTKYYFYAYYVLRTLTAMVCEGSVLCLALAYVADNIPENRRASVFGMLSGVNSSAFVCGNLSARFLSSASTFQVSALGTVISAVYMRVFLPESMADAAKEAEAEASLLEKDTTGNSGGMFKTMPSFRDTMSLLRSSVTLSQAAIIAFFLSLADAGFTSSLMYYLKATFHFKKDQFADIIVLSGIAGTVSQMLIMPVLAPVIGEVKLLSVGLFFSGVHMFLYSVAWSSWVPYAAAMFSVLGVVAQPSLRSIASKQVGPNEQGKAQGCISGLSSFANVLSPLVFSPLTALFLSTSAPFHFPGFSIACAGFAMVIALVQGLMIRSAPPVSNSKFGNCNCMEP
ncbi:uncharacterized protein LOC127808461 isoform X4 [Diospyros lotus]|uniref:uncharacterized protein LOC127808461 isoform X4 n=1 Tax=Diospyros lotus TaxID=55363 RepID=UPI00225A4339|nr:uncharacterized protein LOC127808461 isoform X4 [Diospyros lotus]